MTQWTRDDLPEAALLHRAYLDGGFTTGLNAVVEHLNAHHPKPVHPMDPEMARLRREHADAARDRDAAVERADQAEARIEGWREAHDALMENPCPVTLDEVEKAIDTGVRGTTDGDLIDPDADLPAGECARLAINAVWALVSGDDPAVYVVRESDIAAVEVERHGDTWKANGWVHIVRNLTEARSDIRADSEVLARSLAVARAIEAEQAVDTVELLAGQIEDATRQAVREVIDALGKSVDTQAVEDSILATVGDDAQWLARHVLGQEADHA